MANTTEDEIYQNFLEVSQQNAAAEGQSLASLILQAEQVRQDMAQQTAGASNTVRRSSGSQSGSDDGESVFSTVLDVFKGGFGVSPLVQGIASLFGSGDDSPAATPLVKYALPPAINFQAAEVGGQIASADYDQSGTPREYGLVPAATAPAPGGSSANTGSAAAQAAQITVNVQAMDARSFMDRSSDIALAVRDAMLNLNAINDVVNDL
jgi:hypothetical protein